MTSLTRYAIVSALLFSCAGFFVRAHPQTKTPKKGSVAGKITIKGKGAPGIVVGLRISEPATPYEASFKAKTDQEGNYRITDVPAGTYQAAPAAPAFVVSAVNNQRTQTVVLTEGEDVEGIDFSLVRGAVITGKVTDAEGRPVIEQRVSLLMANPPANQRGMYSFSGVQTDDRGIYRMYGIAAGRYKVAVGQGEDNNFFINVGAGRPSYKQTFYPDASEATKATVVEVTEGSEASNIDITVGRATQTFAASGHVVDGENGQPIVSARFGLQLIIDEQRHSYVSTTATSNSQGEFRVENLTPGKYGIFLLPRPDSDLHSDAVAFDIVDQDVSGLVVKTSKGGASLAGIVVLENTDDKAVMAKLMQLRVQGYVQNPGFSPNAGRSAPINSDGSFFLNGLQSGNVYISLGAQDRSLMKGFSVSRIQRDGIIESRGIVVKNEDQITGVRILVSYGNATVHGVVQIRDDTLPAGSHIFVRVTREGETRSNIRPPQVDSRGHFLIEGMPGGVYNFETSVFIPGAPRRQPPTVKQQVNVSDGVVTEVIITVDLKPSPGSTTP